MSGEPMELDHITNFSAKRSVYESIMRPTPVSEDGLDEQDQQLIELMKLLTADQKEFLRAQLLTLTGRDK